MSADLVLLDCDYFDEAGVPDEDIKSVRSLLTLMGGKVVYGGTDAR